MFLLLIFSFICAFIMTVIIYFVVHRMYPVPWGTIDSIHIPPLFICAFLFVFSTVKYFNAL